MVNNVTVVIRNVGERTLDSCYNIIARQVNKDQIFIVREAPFSKAVIKTFQIGVKQNREWTLAVDADCLLTENTIEEMIANAIKFGDKLYTYQGMVLDYLHGEYRFSGPHLYNTKILQKGLEVVKNNQLEIRPESFTYKALAKEGYITYCDNKCYGLHDFDQHPMDYYRKGFFHARKSLDQQLLQLFKNCKRNISNNSNYEIALQGLLDGIAHIGEVKVDIEHFNNLKKNNKKIEQIEKSNSKTLSTNYNYVDDILKENKLKNPNKQPNSFKPYYLDNKGKHIIFSKQNFVKKIITKSFIYVGNLLLKKGLKMREV